MTIDPLDSNDAKCARADLPALAKAMQQARSSGDALLGSPPHVATLLALAALQELDCRSAWGARRGYTPFQVSQVTGGASSTVARRLRDLAERGFVSRSHQGQTALYRAAEFEQGA